LYPASSEAALQKSELWLVQHLQVQERFGVSITVLRETAEGDLDLDHLHSILQSSTGGQGDGAGLTVVSISHVPTSSGRVYDAEGVGSVVSQFPGPHAQTMRAARSLACLRQHQPTTLCHIRASLELRNGKLAAATLQDLTHTDSSVWSDRFHHGAAGHLVRLQEETRGVPR
jgi:hypothetical protein